VNLAAYPKERRPAMTAGELVGLFGVNAPGRRATPEAVALLATTLEASAEDVLVGFYADASELAGDLDQSPTVRRLAAALAATCESILLAELADWDAVFSLIDAGIAAPNHHTNRRK
jgi:hypothetical protein